MFNSNISHEIQFYLIDYQQNYTLDIYGDNSKGNYSMNSSHALDTCKVTQEEQFEHLL